MSFNQFLSILNARKKTALFTLLITVLTTLLISISLPKSFEASTSIVVNLSGTDPVTGSRLPAQLIPGYIATQVDVIKSRNVALKVVDNLNLYSNSSYVEAFYEETRGSGSIRNWVADLLLQNLEVTPSRESSVIVLSYESNDPEFASLLANSFAEAYVETNLQLKIEPSKRTAAWFKKQVEEMRKDLIDAQDALSRYQREKGIVSIDERLDVETSRLSQLSQQLVLAETELLELKFKRDAIELNGLESTGVEFVSGSILKELKVALSRSEIKLDELGQRVSSQHPEFLATKAELIGLRNKLKKEMQLVLSRFESSVLVAEQRVRELRSVIKEQKEVLLTINDDRDMLNILTKDVEDSKQILSVATQRLSQTALEGKSSETDISILNAAVTPTEHSSPNLLVNVLLSVFFGSLLSVGIVALIESLSRRVRVVEDIENGLELPLLGEVMYVQVPKLKR